MALELLSGPSVVYDPATGAPRSFSPFSAQSIWLDPRGIMYHLPELALGRALIQMDGAVTVSGLGRRLDGTSTCNPALVVRGGSPAVPDAGQRTYGGIEITVGAPARVWAYHPITLVEDEQLSDAAPDRGNAGLGMVFLPDRFLRLQGNAVQASAGFGVAWQTEATLPITGAAAVSWADHPNEIWISNRAGQAVRYSLGNRAAIGSVLTTATPNIGLYYSRKHRVWVSLSVGAVAGQNVMRVWSTRPHAMVLSAPVAASTVRQGAAVELSTRLTGAHADPCADEVVGWSVSGGGALLGTSSRTDANGYARNTLQVPLGVVGPIVVDVQAQIA